MTNVSFVRLHEDAKLPVYATDGAAGADLHSIEDMILESGERALVPTGLACSIPEGFEIQVRPRSGLAFKNGVTVLNAPGTIDSDYQGHLFVMLYNTDASPHLIVKGDRIAQIVVAPVIQATFSFIDAIPEKTARGADGFGSTGR